MKKVWIGLLGGVLAVALLLSAGCDRKPGADSSAPDSSSDIHGDATRSPVSLATLSVFSASKVEQVIGVFQDLVCVYGEHNGQRGFFFVTTAGEVLADRVFYHASAEFIYEDGGGFYTYVRTSDHAWHLFYSDGELSAEIDDPTDSEIYERYMEEVDGKELWGIRRYGESVLPPTYAWIETVNDVRYNYAVTAEGQPVLIDWEGTARVTLPEQCTGFAAGPAGFVGKFQQGEGAPLYSLLDFTGRQLAAEFCEDLTVVQKGLAAGVQEGKLVLVDASGKVCLRTDYATVRERGAVAFDGDTVAAVLADNTLGVYRVTFAEEPLLRAALELVNGAEQIEMLYNRGGNAGGKGVEGEDYLKKGTELVCMGQQVVLESDYELFIGYFPTFQVTNWKELERAVESVYTRDTAVEAFYTTSSKHAPHFIEYNGKLFGVLADGAYCAHWDEGSLTVLSQTADTACFSIRSYVDYPTEDSLTTHYFRMRKTDVGWRLESAYLGDDSEEEMLRKMAYRATLREYASQHGVDAAAYAVQNIDGTQGDELLLITADCRLLVYAYESGQVKQVDTWTYSTATTAFLYSGSWKTPGLVVFSHGGGQEHLRYMTMVDGTLTFTDVLSQTPDGKNVTELTDDGALLALAKAAYENNDYLNFRLLPGKAGNTDASAPDVAGADTFLYRPKEAEAPYTCAVYWHERESAGFGCVDKVTLLEQKTGKVVQSLQVEENEIALRKQELVYFMDVTFDGYADLLIPSSYGARYRALMVYRWDAAEKRLVRVPTVLLEPAIDKQEKVIRSYTAGSMISSYSVLEYDEGKQDFVCTRSLYYEPVDDWRDERGLRLVVKENGQVSEQTVRGYAYEPDLTDERVAPYFADGSLWDLDSDKWEMTDCFWQDE